MVDTKKFNNHLDSLQVSLFWITNNNGMRVGISNYGACIVSIITQDKQGNHIDTILGFDSLEGYLNAPESYFGATIGRYANRIANGKFVVDNHTYLLATNNGKNHLHGGTKGFHQQVWQIVHQMNNAITLSYLSKDGEEGYPGNLHTLVHFSLNDNNELSMQYEWTTDKITIANITNHAFFNLHGEGNGSVLDHILEIKAEQFLPIDHTAIPLGKAMKVENTPFDFRTPKAIGKEIHSEDIQIKNGMGYDHCFVLQNDKKLETVASCYSPLTGILLEVATDMPGMQLYTGNWLNNVYQGKSGRYYGKQEAFCLETQFFPNTPNEPSFPSCIVRPSEKFKTTTIYKYGIKKNC